MSFLSRNLRIGAWVQGNWTSFLGSWRSPTYLTSSGVVTLDQLHPPHHLLEPKKPFAWEVKCLKNLRKKCSCIQLKDIRSVICFVDWLFAFKVGRTTSFAITEFELFKSVFLCCNVSCQVTYKSWCISCRKRMHNGNWEWNLMQCSQNCHVVACILVWINSLHKLACWTRDSTEPQKPNNPNQLMLFVFSFWFVWNWF